ncbi:unnamed protein product, partial [marine sediment metagenome]
TKTFALQATVKAGSNNETKSLLGISHFIEHMLFEGTKNRTDMQISSEIEGIGGEIGAFTSNERTCFYIKALKRHFDRALDVLADVIQNPLLDKSKIEKERKIILSEVNTRYDDPRFYQWILFQKTLFKKHPVKNSTIGTLKTIKSITKRNILDYYKRYYVPNNITITIVGNIKNPIAKIKRKFCFRKCKLVQNIRIREPIQKGIQKASEKRHTKNSYLVTGYKTVPRSNRDSYVLDVIESILGKPLSGRLFEEIRSKRGLAYDVGVYHDSSKDYGFFAVYINTDKKNLSKCKKIILEQFKNLDNISKKELEESKNYIEGKFTADNEDNQQLADEMGFLDTVSNIKNFGSYIQKIKMVTKSDITKAMKKYFTKNYTIITIKQK